MKSLWTLTSSIPERKPLEGDMTIDVAIIGAGMAGLLTAYLLKERGANPVILEANTIASGQTKNTTAKITSQHGLFYDALITNMGIETAQKYAEANQAAIDEYERIIKAHKIECNFSRLPNYVYSTEELTPLKLEAYAAQSVGLPASLTTDTTLPFPVVAAVRFDNQAQFHPLLFIKAIAEGLTIYEHTPVKTVEENTLVTDRYLVKAKEIVFATHYPFINAPGYYFLRMHQERSYAIALKDAQKLDGMYISMDSNGYSFRNHEDVLILGGAGHRTGENSKGGRYAKLREAAKKFYPESREIANWSAQDCMPLDDVPYIGRYSENTPNWYVATGFKKWGMTSSMVAAMLISDMISGKKNPHAETFSPQRTTVAASSPAFFEEAAQAVKGLTRRLLTLPQETIDGLPAGHGGIVEANGHKVGVYKDETNEVHMVSVKCPHLGCQLEWNPDEKSWDCPCHGSRFDYEGHLINNPAQEDIVIE